ncbi:MAG: 3'-5' exonuclease [Bdellovibrionales bacterium]|nr:3'-5' exonuclease [Bdellovibrionales bacterium]
MSILVFDLETTGLNPSEDQIVEIALQVGLGRNSEIKTRRIKPTRKISKEATEVHGITNADVKDCPGFRQVGKSLRQFFVDAETIVGYNVTFDLQVMMAEFHRNNIEPVAFHEKYIIDPLNIWRKLRPRKLENAYQEFCGKELTNAHSAEGDVKATGEVFEGMKKYFGLESSSLEELSALSLPEDWVGVNNQIRWKNGEALFAFGKGRGEPVWDYLQNNPSYFDWMRGANFLPHVLDICHSALEMEKDQFLAWVRETFRKS